MAFNINDIRSRLNPARPTLFTVYLELPQIVGAEAAGGSLTTGRFSFNCRATSIPPAIIGQIEVPYFGRMMKVPGDRVFENWSVQVYNDENYQVRNAFEAWSGAMNTLAGNKAINTGAPSIFKAADATIQHFGKNGDVIKQYRMIGLFPTNVGEMELSWEAQNQIQLFNVTFAYDYWVPDFPANVVAVG